MAITFAQVQGLGDVMPNDRHTLYFPSLPQGVSGDTLTLRHGTMTSPPWEVGQIIVKLMGWSLAFAGRRNNPNTFTMSFTETTDAPVIKALVGWQALCSGLKEPTGKLKAQYAVKGKLVVADTTGKYALTCEMLNVWPQSIVMGGFEETTGAWHHDCTFSVDAVDPVGLTTHETAIASLSTNSNLNSTNTQETSAALTYLNRNSGLYNTPSTLSAAMQSQLFVSQFFT